jgi:transcriptional regulator GlxA family with amidase domain
MHCITAGAGAGAAAALDAMHSQPEKGWTVTDLARVGTVSRATIAERFGRLVGQPPLR